jgi:hypothetical protein
VTAPRLGYQLGRSLIAALGADCEFAASLARLAISRPDSVLSTAAVAQYGTGAGLRVAEDFVQRGWLTRCEAGWRAPPSRTLPDGLATFLEGAAAMHASRTDESRAIAAVTLPLAPSAIASILPTIAVTHAALIPTAEAFDRVADAAAERLTIMTPFLNDDGLSWALETFVRTKAKQRCLVVRTGTAARNALERKWAELTAAGVEVLVYFLRAADGEGYETFHAKVVLADSSLAYVGSANLLGYARHSVELGLLADGRAAQVVATVVRAIERAAVPFSPAEGREFDAARRR